MTEFSIRQWLATRLPLDEFLYFLKHKSIPIHRHSHWYYLGNILLTCFLIQVITGIVLLFYYQPTPDTAYESIRSIILNVPHGWLIRSIHKWSANFMVAAAWVHLFSVFFLKAYRQPREFTWLSGIILFILVMGLGFSGYLLPWSEHAFFATRVGTGIAGQIPLIGEGLKIFLRGGEEVGAATLTRFFALHVVFFPLALAIMVGFHLLLVQLHGVSVPPSMEKKKSSLEQIPFFPEVILRDLALSCWMMAFIVMLAVFFPCEIGKKLDPLISSPEAVNPEWYFLFIYKMLQMLPSRIGHMDGSRVGILLLSLGFLFIFFVPFFDARSARGQSSPFFSLVGIVMVGFILSMTLLALFTMTATTPDMTDNINQIQSLFALHSLPGLIVFLGMTISFGILLWVKSRDLAMLRKKGFFQKR